MANEEGSENDTRMGGVGLLGWFKRKILPLVGLVLVIAIMAAIYYFYWRYPGMFRELKAYGYLGTFVISIVLNASIILPVSNMAVMIALGTTLSPPVFLGITLPPPVLVGLLGGLGAAIGEFTGYIAGRSGRDLIARSQVYGRVEGWVRRWGWLAIFVFSVVPFVFDLVGIAAGALRLPAWKFFIPCWLGRTVSYVFVVTLAAWGLRIWVPWLN